MSFKPFVDAILISKNGADISSAQLNWNPHSSFKGVALKHLITGAENNGRASFHLVRVEPGCALAQHTHEGKWEIHEVLEGSGVAIINGKQIPYQPGCIALIPEDTPHEVCANESGLLFIAIFFSALL